MPNTLAYYSGTLMVTKKGFRSFVPGLSLLRASSNWFLRGVSRHGDPAVFVRLTFFFSLRDDGVFGAVEVVGKLFDFLLQGVDVGVVQDPGVVLAFPLLMSTL
jgi:hypothetical protein